VDKTKRDASLQSSQNTYLEAIPHAYRRSSARDSSLQRKFRMWLASLCPEIFTLFNVIVKPTISIWTAVPLQASPSRSLRPAILRVVHPPSRPRPPLGPLPLIRGQQHPIARLVANSGRLVSNVWGPCPERWSEYN